LERKQSFSTATVVITQNSSMSDIEMLRQQ
jgi:hypothetical protein